MSAAGRAASGARLVEARRRDETARVARLHTYARGASGALDDFSAIAQAAAHLCDTPSAMILLLDQGHWWNLASSGWDGPARGPRRGSLCERTCLLGGLLEIADARAERCWEAEPLVSAPPHVRFFAAVPIVTADGVVLGVLAVSAPSARRLAPGQKSALARLAALAMALLGARASARSGMLAAVDRDCELWRAVLEDLLQAGREAKAMREAVGQLAGGVASDLSAALGVITGQAALLADRHPCGSLGQQQLEQILGASVRARDLVSRMETFARLDGAAPQPVDAVAVVGRALAAVRAALPERVGLTYHCTLEAAPLLADPAQVELVVANLCSNAREAIDGVGAIAVRLADAPATPGYLWLQVGGSGGGIAPRGPGRGLELPAVLAAVSLLRGEIQVDSTPGGGTRVNLYLPLAIGIPPGLAATN
jgi:signal transduction histidine kinase